MTTRDTRWPAGTPNWADISVPDIDAALAFYGSVVGWTFHDTGEEFAHYRIAMVGERSVAGIGPKIAADQPTGWLVYLASDDADATAKAISESGGRVLAEPFDVGEVCRLVIAQDTTGGTFGVFQANRSIGLEVVDEPGALVWEDARLTDVAAGREFYTAVFGYRYSEIPGMVLDQYGTFGPGDRPWGGMGGIWGAEEGTPSHWLPYFTVADVDASVRAARDGGGGVAQQPENTPFGRIGVLTDPFGAQFGVHGPTSG